jgi:hypothetical protein
LSAPRWTTSVGIVLGGTGGAVAALLGSPRAPAVVAPAPAVQTSAEAAPQRAVESEPATLASAVPSTTPLAAVSAFSPSAAAAPAVPVAIASAPATPPASTVAAAPALDVPATLEALHKSMLLCDQKKNFDECTRASMALDLGTTGSADPAQAKRFRKIALTHLVAQCEAGSAHACFVLASKYRAGTELPATPTAAAVLEKRALDLCRHNTAPECPTP